MNKPTTEQINAMALELVTRCIEEEAVYQLGKGPAWSCSTRKEAMGMIIDNGYVICRPSGGRRFWYATEAGEQFVAEAN